MKVISNSTIPLVPTKLYKIIIIYQANLPHQTTISGVMLLLEFARISIHDLILLESDIFSCYKVGLLER